MDDLMITYDPKEDKDLDAIDHWIMDTLLKGAPYVGMSRDEIMKAVIEEAYR